MATIFDYLHWRGDLSFRHSSFNIVDSMILTRFSYLPFDTIITDTPISLKNACQQFIKLNKETSDDIVLQKDVELLNVLMHTRRFSRLMLQHYQNIIEPDKEAQFSAMMIHIDKHTTYVAFRGTDLTLVGWKEDLNMAFKTKIPSQAMAVNYLETHAASLHKRLIIGGHSKGGNLAIYASSFCHASIQSKIISVHNFDGPGFNETILSHENYLTHEHKIQTFVPQTAIIGMLLNHGAPYKVVKSSSIGLGQHDTYHWEIDVNDFIYVDDTDKHSQQIKHAITTLLDATPTKNRKELIDTAYHLLQSADISNIRDFTVHVPKKLYKLFTSYQQLDKEKSDLIIQAIQILLKSFITKPK